MVESDRQLLFRAHAARTKARQEVSSQCGAKLSPHRETTQKWTAVRLRLADVGQQSQM